MRALIICFMILVAQFAQAHEKLIGAFGIPIGITISKLNSMTNVQEASSDKGIHTYSVTPPIKNKLFFYYEVRSEGKPEKVFDISATGVIKGRKACLSVLHGLEASVKNKYGGIQKDVERGSSGEKKYLFAIHPVNSNYFVGGGCYETSYERDGITEKKKGFFYDEKNVVYTYTINYGDTNLFSHNGDDPDLDNSGL